MLKYKVKLGNNNIKTEELVWRDKYLSPDLSYITGVTDTSYHLEKYSYLMSKNSINDMSSPLDLECVNVKRQGFIVVKDKEYDTYSSSTITYALNNSGETIDYRYTYNNGKYFYWSEFEKEEGEDVAKSGYTITNILTYNDADKKIVDGVKIACQKDYNPIKIDTVYWIENGEVEIDGEIYIYDSNEGDKGILKFKDNGEALDASAITRCKTIEFHPYSAASDYEEVTKFMLSKGEGKEESFERITFAKYNYYVKYKDHYCRVIQSISGDTFQFYCEIPLYLLSATTEDWGGDNMAMKEYPLYFVQPDVYEESQYKECYDDAHLINQKNVSVVDEDGLVSGHSVYNMNDLKDTHAFIHIDAEDTFFTVEYDLLNGNDGNEIIVYFDNVYASLDYGSQIIFENISESEHESLVYNAKDYGSELDEEYIVFNSKKYVVEKNILDKVIINEKEYDIEYINGKEGGKDCLVYIEDEEVPMRIQDNGDGNFTLKRYGEIVSSTTSSVTSIVGAEYVINPYDGVVIDGYKYPIIQVDSGYTYADIKLPRKHTFMVVEKIGNSTYVCEPNIGNGDFTEVFDRYITAYICTDVVENQDYCRMYIDNKIFGDTFITKELPFTTYSYPSSSDDYYNLFDDLTIFVKSGYIGIPLNLSTDLSNNVLQDDIVERDFYEVERQKAINPIVDMEKDIYSPKYIDGGDKSYIGSSTVFKSVDKINLNFHFRTRNLDSWKVNDGNTMYDTSGTSDNWFVTDFHPYCDILANGDLRRSSGDTLMRASDLMGFLYFTNNDIFYQRSKVSKSFARLSFYDSTDPQTQSLLATSCVFVDEHKLFKKFIDNSQKYENNFASTSMPIFIKNEDGYIDESKRDEASKKNIYIANKISVNTELLNGNSEYTSYSGNCGNVDIGNEDHRLSSRLVVENKYTTETSSEGFYIYIFREYAEKLHPKPIYMKVEFNHAGVGKTIPFTIPMHWEKKSTDSKKMVPVSALTLTNEDDIKELKEGFPLSYVYAQTYIPLYAVYDFNNKEYGYVFDSRYVSENEDGVINLNLFEMKIKDESSKSSSEDIDIKAIINVNEEQFNKMAFNYKTE